MGYAGIIEHRAGGSRYENANLASRKAARPGLADARGICASGLMPIRMRGRVTAATGTRTRRSALVTTYGRRSRAALQIGHAALQIGHYERVLPMLVEPAR